MPYDRQIPDAPIAASMLPRVEAADLKSQDILVLTQPGNTIGQKNKSMELGALFGSDLFKFAGLYNSLIKSNILDYSGALASASTTGSFTEVCHLDVDPRMDVEFHVWGTSNTAGDSGDTYGNFEYGLKARTRQMYLPDDVDRDLIAFGGYAGFRNTDGVGPSNPAYNARFGLIPHDYSGDIVAAYPTKRVTLFLAAGMTNNPYHATIPSEFNLKIQATIYPSKYVSDALKATGG